MTSRYYLYDMPQEYSFTFENLCKGEYLVEITEQYLDYIRQMQTEEIAGITGAHLEQRNLESPALAERMNALSCS